MAKLTAVGPVSNGAERIIETQVPYIVAVTIEGTADLLCHRWNVEGVEAKAKAAKNSAAKKTDDIESYVYRDDDGFIALPGEYVRQSIIHAAKYRQDPRSPRKSAMDLYKAGVVALTMYAPLNSGVTTWDYEHKARVQVQRNGITRIRPAFKAGWVASFDMMVNLPEYINSHDLHDTLTQAGRLVGVGDFRPTYGRFLIKEFVVVEDEER